MDDAELLMRAILENPAEDVPRLMYADAIEERDPARAEFIRSQCLAGAPDADRWHRSSADCRCATCQSARIEARFADRWASWIAFAPFPAYVVRSGAYVVGAAWHPGDDPARPIYAKFTRGFVTRLDCPTAADFLEYAPAIFARHPVEQVRLRDLRSGWSRDRDGCFFERERRGAPATANTVPAELARSWPDPWSRGRPPTASYKTSASADAALNSACIAFGRKHVGLPCHTRPSTSASRPATARSATTC